MNRAKFTVEKMCDILDVSKTSYYEWLKDKSILYKRDQIKQEVLRIFKLSKNTYGSPRIHQALVDQGIEVSVSTVARVMKSLKIQARPKKRFVLTTDSDHEHKVCENILNREFEETQVNKKWVSDITYILTKQGWVYLTIIMDLADRMIVAWNLSKDMSAKNTTVKAMQLALFRRKVSDVLFHSDRGIQYCCSEFTSLLKQENVEQSMSRKGNCWDNAPAESFFKTLKTECVYKNSYNNYQDAKDSIFDYIERWYNTNRKHSGIQFMSPLQKHYFLTQTAA